MRIIPKKIKVKNTVWKCYSMPDIIVALIMFSIIFIAITKGVWAIAVIGGLLSIVMFMPTQDGIFYACILDNLKFLFAKKTYTDTAVKDKERIETLIGIKALKENGIIEYTNGCFGRVIKVGQKNFGIEDESEQNIDIGYFSAALKQLDGTQSAELVKIDRPVNLDVFAGELFERLEQVKNADENKVIKNTKTELLRERIDGVDRLN
ncbi:MAG: hypothetical protein ACLTE4_06205, partial [Christensenellaceae bacterium]